MGRFIESIIQKSRQAYAWLVTRAEAVAKTVRDWWHRYNEYLERLRSHSEYVQEVIDSNVEYELEDIDIQLIKRLKLAIDSLEGGKLADNLKLKTFEQRKDYFENVLFPCVAREMGISAKFLGWTSGNVTTAGWYSFNDGGIVLNELYLTTDDPHLIKILINTLIHECRHAIQYEAVNSINTHGCSPELIEQWRRNIVNYIQPEEDDEAYYKQIMEWDARQIADKVYPDDLYSNSDKS